MKVRELGADRSCLAGIPVTDLEPIFPGRTRTVVVEADGKVVGSMTVVLVPHIEATWIDPAHRNAGVARALARKTWELAREEGGAWGFGSADDEATASMLLRLGGSPVRQSFYLMPLDRRL